MLSPLAAVERASTDPTSPPPPPSLPSGSSEDLISPSSQQSSTALTTTKRGPILLSLPSHLHIEDVYIQSGRPKRAALEVRNDGPDELRVELGSRGGGDVEFWQEPPAERKDTSKSSNISLPSSRQSSSSHRSASPLPPSSQPIKHILLQPYSSSSLNFTFVPPPPQTSSPAATEDPAALVTPKALPVNSDLLLATPNAGGVLRGAMQKAPTWWLDGEERGVAGAGGAEQPVESVVVLAEKENTPSSVLEGLDGVQVYGIAGLGGLGAAGGDPLRSSASVHGDLVFVASRISALKRSMLSDPEGPESQEDTPVIEEDAPETFTVPYSASVCESIFLASAVDPSLTPSCQPLEPSISFQGSLSHSSQLSLNFGTSLPPRTAASRDFVVRNASDIPLALSCAVVFDSSPWQVWAALEDLDSQEKYPLGGEGTDGRKVVLLPSIGPLETRRFGLSVFVGVDGAGGDDFFLDVLVCNLNNPSNTVLLQGSGSTAFDPSAEQNILQVLSGPSVDFGSIIRGSSIRHLIRVKNTGDEPIEVTLGKEVGWDVKFLFGGVKGDELLNDEALGPVVDQQSLQSLRGGVLGAASGMEDQQPSRRSTGLSSNGSDGSNAQVNFLGRAGASTFVGGSESALLQPKPVSSVVDRAFPTSSGAPRSSSPFRASSTLSTTTESVSSADGSSFLDSSIDRSLSRTTSRRSDDPGPPPSPTDHSSSQHQTRSPVPTSPPRSTRSSNPSSATPPNISSHESLLRRPWALESTASNITANQIEELVMRPGTEYRVWLSYTPSQDVPLFVDPGSLVATTFRVTLDYSPSSPATVSTTSASRGALGSRSSKAVYRRRKIIPCAASVCSAGIKVTPSVLDFGQVTVGSSKSSSINVTNLSDLAAKIELRFISKVLSVSRIFFTIPPRESTTEKIDFFPRRINPHYTKQLNVRSLLDRSKDQMVEIHAQNVDLDGVTLHSHLYKIYTPSGMNIVDFGSVIVNSPAIRTITIKNVQSSNLLLHFAAAQPEDLAIYAKASELPPKPPAPVSVDAEGVVAPAAPEKMPKPAPISNRERFLDSMAAREAVGEAEVRFPTVQTSRQRDKSTVRGAPAADGEVAPKPINVLGALKKGMKGRLVAIHGNVVIFKDRSLLSGFEYLDLAGPPLETHRSPSLMETLAIKENEDPSRLSGKFPNIVKTLFAGKSSKSKSSAAPSTSANTCPPDDPTCSTTQPFKVPSTPKKKVRSTTHNPAEASETGSVSTPGTKGPSAQVEADEVRSPALTGKRKQRAEPVDAADVSRLSLDELLSAIEHRDIVQTLKAGGASRETEELFVRTTINLKAALQSAIDTGKLVPVTDLTIAGDTDRQLVLVMKAKGGSRPHVQGDRSRRQDSRILIRLVDFDRSLGERFPGLAVEEDQLPVRELLVRSNMSRSVLDVAQTHINFGNLEKGDSKSKTIIIHNRSESPGLFRIRLSGKISSNDFKLGEGRYGVVEPFGKKEVAGFVFTPSMPGLFSESLIVENVQDGDNDMVVSVKATVRKTYSFWVSPLDLTIPDVDFSQSIDNHFGLFSITNSSKGDRSFVVEVDPPPPELASPCSLSVQLSDGESKTILTKAEDEELENILQKLKIARRKAKPDKIEKYEARLVELGVPIPDVSTDAGEPSSTAPPSSTTTSESNAPTPRSTSPTQPTPSTTPPSSKILSSSTTRLAVPLAAGQSQTIRAGLSPLFGPLGPPTSTEGAEATPSPDLRLTLRIWEKKNSDDVRVVTVIIPRTPPTTSSPTLSSPSAT